MSIFKKYFITIISLILLNQTVNADTQATQISRYITVQNQALVAQQNLLQQTFQVKFPNSVKTIEDAIKHLLRFSGYSLVEKNMLSKEAQNLLALPLPQTHRNLGPLSLEDGLITLIGNPYGLLIDPIHRLISVRLKPEYQHLL